MEYVVEPYDEKYSSAWDDYVLKHPAGNYCQLSGWQRVIESAYGRPAHFWLCRAVGEQIVGLLPSIHLKHPLFGNSLVSMPYLDGGGILADTPEVSRRLLSTAQEYAAARKVAYLELRQLSRKSYSDEEQAAGSPSDKVQMILPLPESSDALFRGFTAKLRSQIRKPEKEGLEFGWGGTKNIADFYKVFTVNMRDLGSPVHSLNFFEILSSIFHKYCKVGVVYLHAKPIGAGIIFRFRQTISIPWASTLRTYNHLAPNMLLYWKFLQYAADSDYKFFNFGRSSLHSGTYRFKKQWGAQPHPLSWQYLRLNQEPIMTGSRRKFLIFMSIWQKLPLSLTVWLGPALRKYISL